MKDLVLEHCRLDGRYDIKRRLGRGSYAEIFVADDALASPNSVHKRVVVKALNVFLQNDLDHDLERTLVENFQNEAIALDRVRHPNIISRLGHGTSKDLRGTVFHYLILEYLPGGDLSRYCRENTIPVSKALDFLEQITAGLAHAHRSGIIHRDIKPQNLLLTRDAAVVKIADFGVARSTQAENPITRVGTNIYAPPEHSPLMTGKTGQLVYSELTPAADIYSLAKTAYVLFTGESPRYSANQPISELPFEFRTQPWAAPLIKILGKATLDDPRKRYQNVTEFWRDLATLASLDELPLRVGGKPGTATGYRPNPNPQPHVARGYSPLAPVKPAFDTSKNLKFKEVSPTKPLTSIRADNHSPLPAGIPRKGPMSVPAAQVPARDPVPPDQPRRKSRRMLRTAGVFFIALALFAGSLYATYNYLLGRPLFGSAGSFSERTATATTDVNLRPAPTTANRPLGVVTRNSKVRILRTSNNWHEVVIIRQGRVRSDAGSSDRGWVYGDYISEDN